jgi:iron complex outermembrane receptor protein
VLRKSALEGKSLSTILVAILLMASNGVYAQSTALEEIIVTAEKREQSLQSVPLSVSALSAENLESSGFTSVSDLPMAIPGLTYSENGTVASPRIRGVGTQNVQAGNENAVATYVDGVYIASSAAQVLSFNNIEQVAVLRGPQGTLFGRNATGGLIQIKTRDPLDELEGRASFTYGNLDTIGANLYVTGGLSANLAADLAVYFSDQGEGFGTNLANGQDVNASETLSLRSKWLLGLGDNTDIRLILDYTDASSDNSAFRPVSGSLPVTGVPFTGDDFDVDTDVQPRASVEQWGASLDLRHAFSNMEFTSITSYRESQWDVDLDVDILPAPFIGVFAESPDEQFTQEFQLQSSADGVLSWTVGLFYLEATGAFEPVVFDGSALLDFIITANTSINTESIAAYAQGTYYFTDNTALTVGLRQTSETKHFTGNQSVFVPSFSLTIPSPQVNDKTEDDAFTWRVALEHQLSDDIFVYASLNTGFKSGGYDVGNGAQALPFEPEELNALEIGMKSEWFDRRLRVNTTVFYYDYENVQLSTFSNGGPLITNGDEAEIMGLEIEATALLSERLTITSNLAVLDSEFGDFFIEPTIALSAGGVGTGPSESAKGKALPFSPDWTGGLAIDYRVPVGAGSLLMTADYFYSDGWFAAEDNRLQQESYSLTNVSLTWYPNQAENINVRAWGRNLGDTDYAMQMSSQVGFADFVSMAPGRTYGVTLNYDF